MTHKVRLITITPDAEHIMGYCARASSPKNQARMDSGELTAAGLLKHCAKSGHWSVFEMANAVFEIETTRAISAQILRHRSFSFQEFSQRYAAVNPDDFSTPEMRRGGTKNRQSSADVMDDSDTQFVVNRSILRSVDAYESLLKAGVATETARMVLPMCSPTKLYMNGTIRSWVHYLALRCKPDVQKEHRLIALDIRAELAELLPTCAEAFGWKEPD
jgi:thymidylate synthase (FAD)